MQITSRVHMTGIALLRVLVGVIFLWAGLEKVLGSGAEGFSAAGFLKFGTAGTLGWPFVTGEVAEGTVFNPTHDVWVTIAGNATLLGIINVLVPFGQIGIGVSLITGLFTRFGAAMGTLMMVLFFFAAWDFAYGVVNQHLTYALICATITGLGAGKYYGLDGIFARSVSPGLRRVLMSGEPATA
jgi:thiosulfate dehydrogenase [quinone] large subunit